MSQIYAPIGYLLNKKFDSNNEKEILELCLSFSDDTEYQKNVKESSHKERLKNLQENGFEW